MRVVIKETTASIVGTVSEVVTVETEVGGRSEEVLNVLERLGIAEPEQERINVRIFVPPVEDQPQQYTRRPDWRPGAPR